MKGFEITGATLKALFAAVAAVAVGVGMLLPAHHKPEVRTQSQFETVELGH